MAGSSHTGFIALIGRPNVGKSTLLNHVLGQKIAIASSRPQTTRNRILGVRNYAEGGTKTQLVLVDTPGLHRPSGPGRSRLNQFMVGEALAALTEVDALVVILECPLPAELKKQMLARPFQIDAGHRYVLEELKRVKKPAILVINKVDLIRDKRLILPMLDAFSKAHDWVSVIPISAKTGDGVPELERQMISLLPEGDPLYPEEMITDRAERWLGAELIREQVFILTKQEIPYSVAISIDEWNERPAKNDQPANVMASATVHVEKEAQKKIIVGQGGRMVREIGTRARQEISNLLGCPVHLKLFVRVDEGWTEKASVLRDLGYERE